MKAWNDKYYITLHNNVCFYVAVSANGTSSVNEMVYNTTTIKKHGKHAIIHHKEKKREVEQKLPEGGEKSQLW